MDIQYRLNSNETPEIMQGLQLPPDMAAIEIDVPSEPWLDRSRNDPATYRPRLLIDILFRSCKVVEECRDKILEGVLQRREDFQSSFTLDLTQEMLRITQVRQPPSEMYHLELHLECYGVKAELKEAEQKKSRESDVVQP